MSPTENAQLTEPETVTLSRIDEADLGDDGTGPMTLAPRIEEAQRLREHFQSLVDEPDDLEGEPAWRAGRLVAVLVALALLAVTVGITLIGLGGTDQRRPEPATEAAAAAAAKADAGRSQVTALPAAPTAVAATPSAPPAASPSATGSPSAGSPGVSPSATASAASSPSASRSPSPSASSVKPTAKPPAPSPKPSPKPSASKPAPAAPACAVTVTTSPGLLSYYGNVALTNRGETLDGWTASFSLPAGYRVQDVSGRSWSQSGGRVTVTGAESLPKDAATAFTFRVGLLLGPRDTGSGWQLNGVGCT